MKEFSDMFKISIFVRNSKFFDIISSNISKKIRHISNDQCAEGVEREDVGFVASINPQDQPAAARKLLIINQNS